jgi:hypothetical protein
MNLLGQALFSAELVRGAGPRRLRTIALCTVDDQVLRPLAVQYGIEVVVDDGSGPRWLTRSSGDAASTSCRESREMRGPTSLLTGSAVPGRVRVTATPGAEPAPAA